jgi:hypothetical protein
MDEIQKHLDMYEHASSSPTQTGGQPQGASASSSEPHTASVTVMEETRETASAPSNNTITNTDVEGSQVTHSLTSNTEGTQQQQQQQQQQSPNGLNAIRIAHELIHDTHEQNAAAGVSDSSSTIDTQIGTHSDGDQAVSNSSSTLDTQTHTPQAQPSSSSSSAGANAPHSSATSGASALRVGIPSAVESPDTTVSGLRFGTHPILLKTVFGFQSTTPFVASGPGSF